MQALRRWWRALWDPGSGPAGPAAAEPSGPVTGGGTTGPDGSDDPPRRAPARRRYAAPSVVDDPRREAHLGAVLQALAGGPLRRDELDRRLGAAAWGPGRLDAVVDHGIATRVLLETDDGAVRARYTD
jgi:hypothetical protein